MAWVSISLFRRLHNTVPPKSILIIAPAWLGDMVMAHSLIQVLLARADHPTISILAPQSTLQITELMPELKNRFLMPDGHGQFGLKARFQVAKQLRAYHFDEAYVLPNTWKSALIPFLARIPKRIGWKGEHRYFLLNDLRYHVEQFPLMVERYVALGRHRSEIPPLRASLTSPFPLPHLVVPDPLREATKTRFDLDLSRPILILSPGAAFGPAKRWPTEFFAKLATIKLDRGSQVWIIGGPKETPLAAEITAIEPRAQSFVGQTSLLEMAALLSYATEVLTNDSGPMHIAASLGVPTFAIFGSSSPGFTPPLGAKTHIIEKHGLSCRPCFQRECPLKHLACLKEISPEEVLAKMDAAS